MKLADRINAARTAKRMTLRKLALEIGVSAPFLSDVEHGRRRLSNDNLILAGKVLGVDLTEYAKTRGVPMCDASKRAEAVTAIVAVLVQHEDADRTAIMEAVKALIATAPKQQAPDFSRLQSRPLGTAAR